MYSVLPSFVLGFHGCDESTGEKILAGKDHLKPSKNPYDWLGSGIYFWENNPQRALNYAKEIKAHPKRCKSKVSKPFVIGAIIDLGRCFNLLDSKYLEILKAGFDDLKLTSEKAGYPMPGNKSDGNSGELLLRPLDCAVIENVHSAFDNDDGLYFDTVRSVYMEGPPLYEGTDIREKNHIQIAVRNTECIKGYFRPIFKE